MSGAKRAVRLAALRLASRALASRERDAGGGPQSWGTGRGPRILLIRPDHLGDVLLATPAATVLHSTLPDSAVDWLVGPWSAEVAGRAGGAADVLTVEFPGFTRRPKRSPFEPYRLLFQEAVRLRARQYDAALILRPDHWWGAFLAAAAGIPRRFGFGVPECRPFLTDALAPPTGHVVEANQQLAYLAATTVGGQPTPDVLPPRFPVEISPPQPAGGVRSLLGVEGKRLLVAIHPGSGAPIKSWPVPRWAAVIQTLRARHDAEIVLTGGLGERDLVRQIADLVEPGPPTLAGETTLDQLAALFAACDLVLGGDSGPLHLAAAVGTPTVRLYGPTDVREFGPWPQNGPHVALVAGLPCQPCRNLLDPPCGATELPACLRAITPEVVAAAISELVPASEPLHDDMLVCRPDRSDGSHSGAGS